MYVRTYVRGRKTIFVVIGLRVFLKKKKRKEVSSFLCTTTLIAHGNDSQIVLPSLFPAFSILILFSFSFFSFLSDLSFCPGIYSSSFFLFLWQERKEEEEEESWKFLCAFPSPSSLFLPPSSSLSHTPAIYFNIFIQCWEERRRKGRDLFFGRKPERLSTLRSKEQYHQKII